MATKQKVMGTISAEERTSCGGLNDKTFNYYLVVINLPRYADIVCNEFTKTR